MEIQVWGWETPLAQNRIPHDRVFIEAQSTVLAHEVPHLISLYSIAGFHIHPMKRFHDWSVPDPQRMPRRAPWASRVGCTETQYCMNGECYFRSVQQWLVDGKLYGRLCFQLCGAMVVVVDPSL